MSVAKMGRLRFLEHELERLEVAATTAAEILQIGAEVAARREALTVRAELDKLRAYERERKRKLTPLQTARGMRIRADAAGSHVAAGKLLLVELDLAAAEAATPPPARVDPEEGLRLVCEAILQMDDRAVDAIARAVEQRRTGRPALRVVDV